MSLFQMIDMTVNTAIRPRAENMEARRLFLWRGAPCRELPDSQKCLFADRFRGSRKLLVDDAACADVEMTNFRVSHLAVGSPTDSPLAPRIVWG